MKQSNRFVLYCFFILIIAAFMTGCASVPELGPPTELQTILNELPAVPVLGKNLKFQFGGDAWIAQVDGKNFSAGSFTSEDNAEGSVLTLTQTHIYSTEQKPGIGGDVGWIATPAPDIVFDYKNGPPAAWSLK